MYSSDNVVMEYINGNVLKWAELYLENSIDFRW